MPDYSKCIIYKLCCNDLNIKEIYVGSTCNFTRRKCEHKKVCNNEKYKGHNLKLYQFIRNHGGFEKWSMILVEEFSCENKQQKLQRERYWYEELKAELNMDYPCRDIKKWRKDNAEHIKKYNEEYKQTNKEEIKKYGKQYREKNIDKIKEYNKKMREEKYEERKEKKTCECGSVVNKYCIRRHERSKKHLDYINKN